MLSLLDSLLEGLHQCTAAVRPWQVQLRVVRCDTRDAGDPGPARGREGAGLLVDPAEHGVSAAVAFESAARQRNLDKQAGFYVDRDDVILSPLEAGAEGVPDLVVLAAQAIEMQLIEDHTRQQDALDGAPVDSSQDLHWMILPLAHPDEFADFIGRSITADAATEQDDPTPREPDGVVGAERAEPNRS
ncbi:hypothetical protein [Dactylosporangium sp. NPDC050588]|uniref:hypothetical protein n=1 Tax=Dactylosporangium sp. NPDC050588 TaxID=3157211 RepID=UPI0033D39EE7